MTIHVMLYVYPYEPCHEKNICACVGGWRGGDETGTTQPVGSATEASQ